MNKESDDNSNLNNILKNVNTKKSFIELLSIILKIDLIDLKIERNTKI